MPQFERGVREGGYAVSIRISASPERAVDAYTTLRPLVAELDYLWAQIAEWVELVDAGELDAEEMLSKLDRWTDEMDGHKNTCIRVREMLSDQAWAIRRATGL